MKNRLNKMVLYKELKTLNGWLSSSSLSHIRKSWLQKKRLQFIAILFFFITSLTSIFNHIAVECVSKIERLLIKISTNKGESKNCKTRMVAHKGNSQLGKYLDNSRESILAAISSNMFNIEIDIVVDGERIFLGRSLPIDNENESRLSLESFLTLYRSQFKTVIYDLKEVRWDEKTWPKLLQLKKFLTIFCFACFARMLPI